MAAQNAAEGVAPLRILALIAAPLVAQRGNDLIPITLLPAQKELDELERACSARDYYSGFYVQRTSDGQICVDRDTLQSRTGASCKLSRLRELVETGN